MNSKFSKTIFLIFFIKGLLAAMRVIEKEKKTYFIFSTNEI